MPDLLVYCVFERSVGVSGVATGIEVEHESWGYAVSIIAAMRSQQSVPQSPCPRWLELRNDYSHEVGGHAHAQRREQSEVSVDTSCQLAHIHGSQSCTLVLTVCYWMGAVGCVSNSIGTGLRHCGRRECVHCQDRRSCDG